MEILKNTHKAKVLAVAIAAFSTLSACGGEEQVSALSNLSTGDVVSVGGQSFLVESISNDNSSITIKAYLAGFTQDFALATITLTRQPSGLFSFESPSLSITYDPASGSLAWSIDPGTTLENLEAEIATSATITSTSTLDAFASGITLSDTDGDGLANIYDDSPYNSGLTSINGAKVKASALGVSFLPSVPFNENWTEGTTSLNSAGDLLATASALHERDIRFFENNGYVAGFSPDFSYDNINVDGLEAAHDAGWTGAGSNLVIFDNFNGSSAYLAMYDFSYGTYSPTHGSNTFNLAYAVAPEASFTFFEMYGDPYSNNADFLDMTYGNSDSSLSFGSLGSSDLFGADAANVSLGVHLTSRASLTDALIGASSFISNTLQPIANHLPNAVIVESAGNNGSVSALSTARGCTAWGGRNSASSCTDVYFALDANYYDALDRTIFVGAYDSATLYLTDYSVSAGLAADHFIVADGTSLLDTGRGTSYAAPRVTGAIGLISHKFPELSAQARKGLILDTATDLGATGVDGVFGHGLLNVTNALSPLGLLR